MGEGTTTPEDGAQPDLDPLIPLPPSPLPADWLRGGQVVPQASYSPNPSREWSLVGGSNKGLAQ